MIYVDSNVILDTLGNDARWQPWSAGQLAVAALDHRLVTGWIVAAEIGHYLDSEQALGTCLSRLSIDVVDAGIDAAWRGAQAFREYRRRGGDRLSLLPDFLIGAHASALGATLLTRDPRRFRSYFADLALITPEEIDD